MRVSTATPAECRDLALETLGIGEGADLFATEGLAASLRRAASFLCPASPKQIVDAVLDAVRPVHPDRDFPREGLADTLDLLVSAGDLIELPHTGETPGRLLYLGPPSYVERHPGQYLLVGIRPFGAPFFGPDLAQAIRYEGHVRTIELDARNAATLMTEQGVHKVRAEQWARTPSSLTLDGVLAQAWQRLAAAGPAGLVEGLTVIDQATRVTFYRGRWRALKPTDTGLFVGRRPQAYGADLWCIVDVANGIPRTLVDLPVEDDTVPGRDEAWRLQAAIDAAAGKPQVFRVKTTSGSGAERTVEFFSPLPRWAERYLEITGTPVQRTSGALCSYRVPEPAIPGLASFLSSKLWMRQVTTEGRNDD